MENKSASGEGSIISVPETPSPAPVEVVGSEDALEELPQRHKRRWRHYKIQEVIKRNQIVLIQVVKEERGSKGAALTTYLSLAGRYTVLMPNTASGGGISRKITVPADRKRLKEIAQELEVPEGMGLHHPHGRRGPHRRRKSSVISSICCGCGKMSAILR